MYEVSTRTIYRDVEATSMAGIPVHSTSGEGGGFEIMKNYKIDSYYYSILLSFVDRCECLKYLHFHTELKGKIADLSKIYGDQFEIEYHFFISQIRPKLTILRRI